MICHKCGGDGPFAVHRAVCKKCRAAQQAALYQAKKQEYNSVHAQYRRRVGWGQHPHPPGYFQAYYQEHKEEIDARSKEWPKLHPEKRRAIVKRSRAKRKKQEEER